MNKQYFQNMFGSTKGAVYRFVSEVPEDHDPIASITEQFIAAIGTDLVSIVVVDMNGTWVVYSDFSEVFVSTIFELITNLTPEIIAEEV